MINWEATKHDRTTCEEDRPEKNVLRCSLCTLKYMEKFNEMKQECIDRHECEVSLTNWNQELYDRNHAMANTATKILMCSAEAHTDLELMFIKLATQIVADFKETPIEQIRESNSLLKKLKKENDKLKEDTT